VQAKGHAVDARLERVVARMDDLFAIDRQERAPALLAELHALLSEMRASSTILPQSVAGKAINYTLKRWAELTRFLSHPIIELSTNWAENSMRPIAIGRKNWLHLGSKEAGPKIAAIFSVVESCRKLGVPIRQYLAHVLPGLADRSIQELAGFTPAAYAANLAK
jgi:transposase